MRRTYTLGCLNDFPICLKKVLLRLKELAYIHAEGIAGELKHGPLALIDKNSVVIILNPDYSTYIDTPYMLWYQRR